MMCANQSYIIHYVAMLKMHYNIDCCQKLSPNVRAFAQAGNPLIVQPGTSAYLKICCGVYQLKLKIELRALTHADACT